MKKNITKVIRVDNETKVLMSNFYEDMKRDKTPPYAIFQADTGDTIVTLYESGKAMFQVVSANIEAGMWTSINKDKEDISYFTDTKKEEKKEEEITLPRNISSVGSDEVGTGDYYGPIVVTASFVSKENIYIYFWMFISNIIIYTIIEHLKIYENYINNLMSQIIHIIQIIFIWFMCFGMLEIS